MEFWLCVRGAWAGARYGWQGSWLVAGREGFWGALATLVGVSSSSPQVPGHPTSMCDAGVNILLFKLHYALHVDLYKQEVHCKTTVDLLFPFIKENDLLSLLNYSPGSVKQLWQTFKMTFWWTEKHQLPGNASHLIIWPTPQVGMMDHVLHSHWPPELAKLGYIVKLDLQNIIMLLWFCISLLCDCVC